MGVPPRVVIASLIAAVALVVNCRNDSSAQSRRAVSVSVGYAASVDELRRWDAIVDGMLRTGDLVVTARRADRWLPDRTHEYLAQHVAGVPVYGAGVMRQLERGVTVSLLGTIQRGLDVAAGPFLPAVEVVARLELSTGAALAAAQSPQLVVLPLPAGAAVPTYRLLADDARVYFAAAADGALVRAVDAFDEQAPPGAGRAGDIVTLDLRFDGQRSAALLEPGPFRTPRWTASDVAAHADVDLHTARTYDYFGRRFGWFGPDGVHGRIVSLVNAGIHGARAYRPPYGPDGAGAYVYGLAEGGSGVALHTVAHELMHGVAHFTVGRRTGTVAGLVTDFATSVRLGPREFTDDDGRTHFCETASFPIQIEGEWQSLPAWCQDGRFLLASAQGAGVNEAFADIFSTAVQFFHEQAGVPAGYVVGGGSDQPFAPRRSLADPASLGDPDAYSARLELALAVDDRRWHYSGFAFEEGRFAGSTQGCCYGGEHWNSTILSHAFYLAVEGGTNRTTGIRVTGAGEARRAQIEAIFFRALSELMPPAMSFPLAADAIRQSAHDLAPGSAAQQAVEQALNAVGLPPANEWEGTAADGRAAGAHEDDSAYRTGDDGGRSPASTGQRAATGGAAALLLADEPAATQSTGWDVRASGVGYMN